jgi:hypothetical protein
MQRAGPVVEGVIEENEQLFFLNNTSQAQKRNAVELKQTMRLPKELLALFGKQGKPAKIEKVSSIHMFESSPQSKCAISYLLSKPDDSDQISIVVVYSVSTNFLLRILRCESEVI